MEKEKKSPAFNIINFSEAYVPPVISNNKNLNIVSWGKKNDYPKYVLDLYNNFGSPLFKNIINKKTKFIAGKGFVEFNSKELEVFVRDTKLANETKKASLDYELFNGFAFEVIWNNAGTKLTSIKHIPFHKLRIGIRDEDVNFPHLLFSHDWEQHRKEEYKPEMIREFNPLIRTGKQIFYYTEYNPQAEFYPIPVASSVFNFVELDYQISVFHLNQAKQGYAPSFILNFATGIPTDEEMDEFARSFKKNYSSTENAGKIIITYSNGSDGKPELTAVNLNDSDERFIMLMEQIDSKIASGSEIPLPLIIQTPGKLGAAGDERAELLYEFQQSYVTPRQEVIEDVLNQLLSTSGFDEEIHLNSYEEDAVKYDSKKEATSRAIMRASSSGIDGILKISESLRTGAISMEAATIMLKLVYAYEQEEIDAILTPSTNPPAPEADDENSPIKE